ncbi:hypothetical protein BaRGS_00005338, partial [Batillaria attramentaria]
ATSAQLAVNLNRETRGLRGSVIAPLYLPSQHGAGQVKPIGHLSVAWPVPPPEINFTPCGGVRTVRVGNPRTCCWNSTTGTEHCLHNKAPHTLTREPRKAVSTPEAGVYCARILQLQVHCYSLHRFLDCTINSTSTRFPPFCFVIFFTPPVTTLLQSVVTSRPATGVFVHKGEQREGSIDHLGRIKSVLQAHVVGILSAPIGCSRPGTDRLQLAAETPVGLECVQCGVAVT